MPRKVIAMKHKLSIVLFLCILSLMWFLLMGCSEDISEDILSQYPKGKIAFQSNRDGNFEIYVMNADGSNPVRLTNNLAVDGSPAWSPDGTKVAFTSNRDGNFEIYVMNADGSNPVNLTNSPLAMNRNPAWSPDGTKIAFVSHDDIYVMNADGSNATNLTNSRSNRSPAWSPDGTKIAFERFGRTSSINIMNAYGSNTVLLRNNDAEDTLRAKEHHVEDGSPAWSPDGTKIAFMYDSGSSTHVNTKKGTITVGRWGIHMINVDGSNPVNLTNNLLATHAFPSWSP